MTRLNRLRSASLLDRAMLLPGFVEERRTIRAHYPADGETCPVCGVVWPCAPVVQVAARLGVEMAA